MVVDEGVGIRMRLLMWMRVLWLDVLRLTTLWRVKGNVNANWKRECQKANVINTRESTQIIIVNHRLSWIITENHRKLRIVLEIDGLMTLLT